MDNSTSKGNILGNANGLFAASREQAPRLHAGSVGYATWQPAMDVYLQRAGAEGIHKNVMTEAEWIKMATESEKWNAEALSSALALAMGTSVPTVVTVEKKDESDSTPKDGKSKPSTSVSSSGVTVSEEMKVARKTITATVKRSREVFGLIYSALPEDLRMQIAHLPQGWAYGLWHWLEDKYQNTEEDSVNELFQIWSTLRQGDDETFDAYRARVNQVNHQLTRAEEEPSKKQYIFTLVGKLHPRYAPAVKSLKVGGKLKTPVDWEYVTAFLNNEERGMLRADSVTDGASVMATSSSTAASNSSSSVWKSAIKGTTRSRIN